MKREKKIIGPFKVGKSKNRLKKKKKKILGEWAWPEHVCGRGLRHVTHDSTQGVKKLSLDAGLQQHQVDVDLKEKFKFIFNF